MGSIHPWMMRLGGLLCSTVALHFAHRDADAQLTTGVQFCEGLNRQACVEQNNCCEWNKRDRACYSAVVGDALCGQPSGGGRFSVGDEVFIGDAANDTHACITVVNPDGSYQVDYRDGVTSNERIEATDAHALVTAETRDCRNPNAGPAARPAAIYDVESSSGLTGASSGVLAISLAATSKITLLTAGGVLMERKGILNVEGRQLFNRVVCTAMLPALLFVTTVQPLGGRLLDLTPLLLGCLVTIIVGNSFGRLFATVMPTDASRKCCIIACTCSNAGAVPMMLMASLCADQTSVLHGSMGCKTPESYAALFAIPMNLLYWTWGVAFLKNSSIEQTRQPYVLDAEESSSHVTRPAMKRSRSDVFEMVDGTLVAKKPAAGHSSLSEVVASSTLAVSTTLSRTTSQTTTGPPQLENGTATPEPPMRDLSVPPSDSELPKRQTSASLGYNYTWSVSLRQKLAARLVQGTQYTLVPLDDLLVSQDEDEAAPNDSSTTWRRRAAGKASELLAMPPNAAILLALLVGLTPLRRLLLLPSDAMSDKSAPPLAVLFDALSAVGAGANPSLMLLLGASLSDTARSYANSRGSESIGSTPDIEERTPSRCRACTDKDPPGLEGARIASCVVLFVRWMLIPATHILGLLLLNWSGFWPALASDVAQRFVLLAEGAVPASMTVLAIAVQQRNRDVENLLGIVLLSQYGICAVTLTASTSLFLAIV